MPNRVRQFSGRLWRWLVERLWQRPAGWIVESDRNAPVRLRFLAHLAAVLLLALVVAVVSALVLWWTLGRPRLAPESPGPLTPTDLYDGVKIALAVVGGIGGLVALVVAYRKQRFAEREHVRAEAAVVREDTKLFTERFGKASEQLGSDKAAVRLAGVYAMASLADDWAEGRQMCIDVLCAYLRMPYTPPAVTATRRDGAGIADIHDLIYFVNERRAHATGHSASNRDANVDRAGFQGGNGGATGTDPGMSVDDEIQWSRLQEQNVRSAIIEVIAQHLRDDAKVSWQGYNFNFRGAVLDGIDFSGVVFRAGKLDFFGAKFTRRVSFIGARLESGEVSFAGSVFSGVKVDFACAKVSNGVVDFFGAEFSKSSVHFDYAEFRKARANFDETVFSDGQVHFGLATFQDGGVEFCGASFSGGGVDFSGTLLLDGRIVFTGANFANASLEFGVRINSGEVDVREAKISGGSLGFANLGLHGGVINCSKISYPGGAITFVCADLASGTVDFREADLSNALIGVAKSQSSGGTVDLSTANLTHTRLVANGALEGFRFPPNWSSHGDSESLEDSTS